MRWRLGDLLEKCLHMFTITHATSWQQTFPDGWNGKQLPILCIHCSWLMMVLMHLCIGLSLQLSCLSSTSTTAPLHARHWRQNKNKWNFRNTSSFNRVKQYGTQCVTCSEDFLKCENLKMCDHHHVTAHLTYVYTHPPTYPLWFHPHKFPLISSCPLILKEILTLCFTLKS